MEALTNQALSFAVYGIQGVLKGPPGRPLGEVADIDALLPLVKEELKAGIEEGLRDAKAAFEARMPQVAEATFRASCVQAGIRAANRFLTEKQAASQ